jgi:hypothetical protein
MIARRIARRLSALWRRRESPKTPEELAMENMLSLIDEEPADERRSAIERFGWIIVLAVVVLWFFLVKAVLDEVGMPPTDYPNLFAVICYGGIFAGLVAIIMSNTRRNRT